MQEFGRNGDQWHRLYAGMPPGSSEAPRVNAVDVSEPLAPYEMMCGLLVPLYAPRAAEEVLFGRRGVTLQTAREVRAAHSRLLVGLLVGFWGNSSIGPPWARCRVCA